MVSLFDTHVDHAYTCSKWTYKKGTPDEVVADFVLVTLEESDVARASVANTQDVRYGPGPRQLYDLYGTDLPKDSEVFVFVHGGYWQAISKESSANLVLPLYNRGFRTLVVDYDLCPNVKLSEIMREIRELFTHLLTADTFSETRGIWLAGHSAGAHLCSTFLDPTYFDTLGHDQQVRVRGLVLISGIFDVTPMLKTSKNDKLKLDGEQEAVAANTFQFFSRKFDGKLFITLGEAESPEFHQQSLDIHEMALKAGTSSEYFVAKDHCHFTVIEKLSDPEVELTRKIISLITS